MTTYLLQSVDENGRTTPMCVVDADTLEDALEELGLAHREGTPADGSVLEPSSEGRAVILLRRFLGTPSYPAIARRTHFALLPLPRLYATRRGPPNTNPSDRTGC